MSEGWNRDADENDDDENIEDEFKTFYDHIIFLIDGRESMFTTNKLGEVCICA